jgi:large subunit ribosomal protein L1
MARGLKMPLDKKTVVNAVKEAKEKSGGKKFNQAVDLILNITEIDMKAPGGKITEVIELPHAAWKPNKIVVVASGELALKARRANADRVLERADLETFAGKKKDLRRIASTFDVFMAEASLMPLVGKILGPVLGPRGKMPVPVPPNADIEALLSKYRKTVVVRMRNQPIIQVSVGAENMSEDELWDNIQAVLRVLDTKLKRGLKNIKLAYIKTSMGAPVKIKP